MRHRFLLRRSFPTKPNSHRKNRLPLTTRQGLLLSVAIGALVALIFTIVFYLHALPTWSE